MTANARAVYVDECVDQRVVPVLAARGITVKTAHGEGMVAASDEAQLLYATARGWLLLTTNRRDFVRLHRQFQVRGTQHEGIIALPQDDAYPTRFAVRCAMPIAWAFTSAGPRNRLWRWSELQVLLLGGMALAGFRGEERALALGNAPT